MKVFYYILLLSVVIFPMNTIYSQASISENLIVLKKNWFIKSSEKITNSGSIISNTKFSYSTWYKADVPSTIMGTLVKDNVYKNVFIGDNLKNIPQKQFQNSWWYRTQFIIPKIIKSKFVKLEFEGINYRANIWLNGKQISDSGYFAGVYRMFEFDISRIVKRNGKNVLAIEVFPPKKGEPTIGFVDWNPIAPDNNMGIWRPVKLKFSGDISLNYPFVQSKINYQSKIAELKVSTELHNNSDKYVSGELTGEIDKIKFSKNIDLEPGEKSIITFTPQEFKQLIIKNPKLWWTYNLGKPSLYKLNLIFKIKQEVSDSIETRFGIREVTDYINSEGYRGYKLNGKKILVLGGGWVDNLFLNNTFENLKTQIDYIKQMGLNTIRLEGFWGESSSIYNLCDENGILMMVGWSCQWEWEEYIGKPVDEYGAIKTPREINLISKSFKDQIKWLRNHPSIFVWLYGSDKIPRPELEKEYQKILKENDPTRPFLASAADHLSNVTGKTAVKMQGPYDYVPPVYWWTAKTIGGALGFNTEEGPGAEIPPIESITKMFPKNDLWPIDSVWNFHCSKYSFSNLNSYNKAMYSRLGKCLNVIDYCTKSQFLNYENTRAMFEANEANKYSSTGVIHWMLNAAWPKLWWQLYDYYLQPGGAFYGTKKACEPIHILYDYGDSGIVVINNTPNTLNNLTAYIQILNFDLTRKYSSNTPVKLMPDQAIKILGLPYIKDLSKTYFVDLILNDGKKILSSNFYCLSSKPDLLDTAKTNWFITPTKDYADLTELNNLPKVHLTVTEKFKTEGARDLVEAEINNNTDKLAFQIVLSVKKGTHGESVLPIFLEDNYFSLLPGEKRIIKGYFYKNDLDGKVPKLIVSGWNID